MQANEQQASCNGVQLNYQCYGNPSQPPIMLIMGLGAQMVLWHETFCRQLANLGYFVVRFDNRDIGKSSWLEGEPHPSQWDLLKFNLFKTELPFAYKLEDMATDTFALMDHLNIKRAHLVGVSMGGMIAQTMATQTPERLISMTSIMSTTGSRQLPSASLGFLLKLFKPMSSNAEKRRQQMLDTLKLLHGSQLPFDDERMQEIVRLCVDRGMNSRGLMRQLAAIIASGDRTPKLKKVDLPTLVLHGDDDKLVPVDCGHATANAIPDAKLKIYQGMGHTIPSVLWDEILTDIHQHASSVS